MDITTSKTARATPDERFARRVVPTTAGCLEWAGSLNNKGYGTFTANGKTWVAHRWAYVRAIGPIPEGAVLDHLCRNRRCVNVNHLEPVEQSANLSRSGLVGKSNAFKTHCPAGHEYRPENTYVPPSRPNRMCRTCRRNKKQAGRAAA